MGEGTSYSVRVGLVENYVRKRGRGSEIFVTQEETYDRGVSLSTIVGTSPFHPRVDPKTRGEACPGLGPERTTEVLVSTFLVTTVSRLFPSLWLFLPLSMSVSSSGCTRP